MGIIYKLFQYLSYYWIWAKRLLNNLSWTSIMLFLPSNRLQTLYSLWLNPLVDKSSHSLILWELELIFKAWFKYRRLTTCYLTIHCSEIIQLSKVQLKKTTTMMSNKEQGRFRMTSERKNRRLFRSLMSKEPSRFLRSSKSRNSSPMRLTTRSIISKRVGSKMKVTRIQPKTTSSRTMRDTSRKSLTFRDKEDSGPTITTTKRRISLRNRWRVISAKLNIRPSSRSQKGTDEPSYF